MVSARTVLASASLSAITPSKSKINAPKAGAPMQGEYETRYRALRGFPAIGNGPSLNKFYFRLCQSARRREALSASGVPRDQPAVHRHAGAGQERGRSPD